MRGGRAPDTSLYKPRPISAPKTRIPATTASSSAASSASSSSSTSAAPTSRGSASSTASIRAAPAATTTGSRTAAFTASGRTTTTRPAAPISRAPTSTATSSRLARTAPSTTGVPAKLAIKSSSSATGTTRSASSSATGIATRSKSATATTSSSTVSKRVPQHVASDQDDRKDFDSGYPECMEIESLDDYSPSATESTFSILAGADELNIITAVRLRPMSTTEKQKGYRRVVDMAASEANWVRIVNPVASVPLAQSSSSSSTSSLRPRSQRTLSTTAAASESAPSSFPSQFTQEFHFDHTFWSFDRAETRKVASQSTIYDNLGLFTIENALQGYNCSIFAYGQTSAGKTYTMMGNESPVPVAGTTGTSAGTPQSTEKGGADTRRGLIPRVCRGLFDRLTSESSSLDFSVHVSYIEIYHEHAYDLLAQTSANNSLMGKESLKVRESPKTGVYVEHANQVHVASFEDIKVLINEGNRVRSVAATNANLRSSRSHAILTLYLKQTGSASSASSCESKKSKICLVDLAGSERADILGTNGIRLREAGTINRSLATLADVISALSKRAAVSAQLHHQSYNSGHQQQQPQEHFVPYRNSILTRLLKESLGGNAKTIMLAAISPCCAHYEESLSTLKYIERAKSVVNVARVNAKSSIDMVDVLRREILELKAQLHRSSASVPSSVSPSPSFSLVPSMMKTCPLTLQLDEEDDEEDLDAKHEPISARNNSEGGASLALNMITEAIAAAESPLYAASLCFDEKEKSRLEREVAKLKAQMRKKEREFQLREYATKALNDKASAQVLRQQAHVINLVGVHNKYLMLAKLRALDRWRYSSRIMSNGGAVSSKAAVAVLPSIDKNVVTDSENNNNEPVDSRTIVQQRVDTKSLAKGEEEEEEEEEEDPACSMDEEEESVSVLNPELKKNSSHSINKQGSEVPLFGSLESKQNTFIGQQQLHQVDVICSSIVTDFFGDTSAPSLLSLMHKTPAISLTSSKDVKSIRSIKGIKSSSSRGSDNNQLEQLPSDDAAHETEGDDDDDERIGENELLIDEIIDHEAESNQAHDSDYRQSNSDIGSTFSKKPGVTAGLSDPSSGREDPCEADQNDDDFDNDEEKDFDDDDEEEDDDCEEFSGSSSKPLSLASQRQRVQSKLARCLDAIDIARKAMGPTVRKLRQITDKSSLQLTSDSAEGLQVGTGMERQLLTHVDKSLVIVNQHVMDLGDTVVSTSARCPLDVSLFTRFEGLLSDFCLQTMGLVCDQLTLGAGGTSAIARDQMDKQLDRFQIKVKELVNMVFCSGSDVGNAVLLISSLMELFGLSERMKFAWYAIDQKNLQRLALFRSQQQQILTMVGSKPPSEATTEKHPKASELLAQYDALVARFEAQTVEFARREEEDRLALLLNTNQLEQEHEQHVAELESELEIAHASITDLEERLLTHVSKVELLEQELELTAVVRTTNELLLKHHSSSGDLNEHGGGHNALMLSELSPFPSTSPSPPSAQCSNIIVKLEEELASALIQINELGANQGAVASINDSQSSSRSDATEGKRPTELSSSALHDACSTLADREMREYMERTSEIEKQNNEAISKLNAVMIERRHSHLGISNMPGIATGTLTDHTAHQVTEIGAGGNAIVTTTSQVERIKQELQNALVRAEALEDQHLKLMMSFENQTDTVLHLEEELYDAQVNGKQAEDTIARLHERVSALETELSAAQELTASLKEDLKDVMSELCVVEVKCGQLDAKCVDLSASCDASKLRVMSLEEELQITKAAAQQVEMEQETLVLESELVATEERRRALEAENALLETRYRDLESAKTLASKENEEFLSVKAAALVDLQNGLAQMTSDKLDLDEQYRALVEQQESEASRLCLMQKQLALAQAQVQELEEYVRRSEDQSRDHENLRIQLEAANEFNARLTEEAAELQRELCTVQTQMTELGARSAADRTEATEPQALVIKQLEAELATSAQQISDMMSQQHDNDAKIERASSDLETANERFTSLESQYSKSQEVFEKLKLSHETSEVRCAQLESSAKALEESNASAESQLAELQQRIVEENVQKAELGQQLSDLASTVLELQSQLDKTNTENAELQERTTGLQAFQVELQKECGRTLHDHGSLREQLDVAQRMNAMLSGEVNELKSELGFAQAQVSKLEAESADDLRASVESYKLLIQKLEVELAASAQQVEDLKAEQQHQQCYHEEQVASNLATQYTDLQSEYDDLKAIHEATETHLVKLESSSRNLETQYSDLQRAFEELKTSHETAKSRCDELASSVKFVEERNQCLESQVSELQQQTVEEAAEKAELERHVDELACSNADLQSQVTSVRAKNEELQEENVELKAQTLELQEKRERASPGHELLREEFDTAHRSNAKSVEEIAELKCQFGSAQAQIANLEAGKTVDEPSTSAAAQALLIQRLEADLTASTQQVSDLTAQQHDTQEQIRRAASNMEAALERSASLEAQYSDLQRIYEELKTHSEATEAHCAELESGVKALEESTNSVEAQFTVLQQQMTQKNAQKAELERQLQELTSKSSELQSQLIRASAGKAEVQAKNAELKAQQLEFQEKCRFLRELTAARKTKVTALAHELRVAYEQYDEVADARHHESAMTQSTKVSDLENQIQAIASQLEAIEADKATLHVSNAAYLTRIQELEQSCELKSSAIVRFEAEHKEAVALLNNSISSLGEQLVAVIQEREQLSTEKADLKQRVTALELDLQTANQQIRELESLELLNVAALEAPGSGSVSAMEKQIALMQAERDVTKHHLEQLQAEYQDLTHSKEQALTELHAELTAAHVHVEHLETQLKILNAQFQAAENSLRVLQDEQTAIIRAHGTELEKQRAQLAQLAEEERGAICMESEVRIAAFNAERVSLSRTIQNLEMELENAQLQVRQSEETLNSQTLLLAEVEESLAVAVARADALENQLQEAKSLHSDQLEALREELMADSEAQLTVLRHEMEELASANEAEANTARALELERQLGEKCAELDKVFDGYELQLSMTSQHHGQELQEALGLTEHWEEQHEVRTSELRALQSDFEAKTELLNAKISNHETIAQNLQVYLERTQSSHFAELKQREAKYNSSMAQFKQEMEQSQAICRDWELKYQELEACVSPDAVRKVKAQIEAAKLHADECEATYRVELENKLQLEFDLASVRKELHVTKQQLTELQCREIELDAKDPSGAARRSQARQNELAELERERQALVEKNVQVEKREASVKLLETSANARLEDLKQQHQSQMQQQEKRVREQLEGSWKAEQTQLLAHIRQLQARVTLLTQRLDESNCRSEMQGEEFHSFRSWSALQELLSDSNTTTTEYNAFGYDGGDSEGDRIPGISTKKKLSPEARRLVLKHLNSLDTWFERAILGKTSSDAGRTERRASLLAVLEGSELGFMNLVVSQENANNTKLAYDNQREDDSDGSDDDDGLVDASDADAVPVELDDLGDELLAMCSSDTQNQKEVDAASEPNYGDFDAIFDRDAALKYAQEEDGSADKHRKSARQLGELLLGVKAQPQAAAVKELCGSSSSPSSCDKYLLYGADAGGLDVKDEVAQLRLTVLKLKQVLDAKEEAILFLDDKMKYYEELLSHAKEGG